MARRHSGMNRHIASELGRTMACPGSKALCKEVVQVKTDSEPARLGNAFHEYMQKRESVGLVDLATRHQVDEHELTSLIRGFPFEIPEGEHEASAELEVGKHKISMRIDYRREIDDTLDGLPGKSWEVFDWKTTQLTEREPAAEYHWQLLANGLQTYREKDCLRVFVAAVLVRLGQHAFQTPFEVDAHNARWIESELIAGLDRAQREASKPPEQRRYVVGTQCDWCPAAAECPALRALQVRPLQLAREYTDLREALDLEITTDTVVQYYQAAKTAKAILGDVETAVKAFITDCGPQPAGEGKVLDIRSAKGRQPAISPGDVKMAFFEQIADHQSATGEEILPGTLKLVTELINGTVQRLADRPRGRATERIGVYKDKA